MKLLDLGFGNEGPGFSFCVWESEVSRFHGSEDEPVSGPPHPSEFKHMVEQQGPAHGTCLYKRPHCFWQHEECLVALFLSLMIFHVMNPHLKPLSQKPSALNKQEGPSLGKLE